MISTLIIVVSSYVHVVVKGSHFVSFVHVIFLELFLNEENYPRELFLAKQQRSAAKVIRFQTIKVYRKYAFMNLMN